MTRSKDNRRIAKNTMYLYIRMLFSMAVALYTSRVVLDVLGVEDFGVYSVVGGVVTLFSFFNSAMSSATQRFFSYELGKNDLKKLGLTFNASVNIHISIGILVFLLAETIGLWFVNNKLNLPIDNHSTVQWIYHFSVLTFLIGIIRVPYNAIIIAHERMAAYAYLSIIEIVLKLFIVYLLVVIQTNKLILYAALVFTITFLIGIVYLVYCIKHFKESKYQFYYEPKLYKTLLSYSGWSLFGNIASVAKAQGSNILLNIFIGPIANAAYAITLQVQSAVNLFISNFQLAVNPQIIKSYANKNKNKTFDLVFKSSKYSFFLILILVIPIIFNIEAILNLWLIEVPHYSSTFIILCLINLLIDSISGPLMMAVQATGKIKYYQIVVGILLFLNLPISIIALKYLSNPNVIFYISISISLLALIFRLFFLDQLMNFPIIKYLKKVIYRIILVCLFSFFISYLLFIKDYLKPDGNIFELIFNVVILMLLVFCTCLILGLDSMEKSYLKNIINERGFKKNNRS